MLESFFKYGSVGFLAALRFNIFSSESFVAEIVLNYLPLCLNIVLPVFRQGVKLK